jgi:hypothetical protein
LVTWSQPTQENRIAKMSSRRLGVIVRQLYVRTSL